MMRFLTGFGRFWYDFIVGDDWKIAVAVVGVMLLTLVGLLTDTLSGTGATVFGGVVLLIVFAGSMVVDVRRSR